MNSSDEGVVFDMEWAGGFITPTQIHCICAVDIGTEKLLSFYEPRPDLGLDGPDGDIAAGVSYLHGRGRLVGHNIVQADFHVLRHLHGWKYDGQVVDTLVLSRLLNPDRKRPYGVKGKFGPHSIEAWAARIGNVQKVQMEDEEWHTFSPKMLERCQNDTLINLNVLKSLHRESLT